MAAVQGMAAIATYREFEAQLGKPVHQVRFERDGAVYFAVSGAAPKDADAAAPVYIFDEKGALVDWNADSARTTPSFRTHWRDALAAAEPVPYAALAPLKVVPEADDAGASAIAPPKWYADLFSRVTARLARLRQNTVFSQIPNMLDVLLSLFTVLCAYLSFLLVNWSRKKILARMTPKTHHTLLADLLEADLPRRAIHLAPLWVAGTLTHFIFPHTSAIYAFLNGLLSIYFIMICCSSASALCNAGFLGLQRNRAFAGVPIKGFFQAIQMVVYGVGIVLILAVLVKQSPVYLLSGLGALTAVLMLIFKDSILGFTAGIMLSGNRMVRLGDWIEMPSADANGDVIDVSLITVKVQNWDKTITTIPAYDLISHSFKNWRGMFESGGRRIKRAIYLDMQSITFASEEMIHEWLKIDLLKPYLAAKLNEVRRYNANNPQSRTSVVNARRITNVGTFRAYCVAYLNANPLIRKDMLMIVRQLELTAQGLPMEIYAFSANTAWVAYEGIQSDIFDHLLAILPVFHLSVYQQPSGNNFTNVFGAVSTLPALEADEPAGDGSKAVSPPPVP